MNLQNKIKLIAAALLNLAYATISAQQATDAAGGNASGSGGSASYSFGQTFYTTHTSTNGSVAQGVQQPYEISIVTEIKEAKDISLSFLVYPNPTTDVCHLNFNLKNNEFVKINVYNTLGELVYIETKNVTAGNVDYVLNLSELQSGNYSVQISFKNNTITKKLTIIK